MSAAFDITSVDLMVTDGDIAVMNLESAHRRSWSRFLQDPLRDGVAEVVVEHEQLTSQFVGDLSALDRIEFLVSELMKVDAASARTALIRARAASMMHCFDDARLFLMRAETGGASTDDVQHLLLNIDQACGVNLHGVLGARRRIASRYNRLEDLVALGSLLADMHEWDDADKTYRRALSGYQDVSPFPPAWVCFQLGVLWGELVPAPERARAAEWYQKAVDVLPCYVKARVHLAEMYLSAGRLSDAEALLRPIITIGDPEVNWRLADVLSAQGKLVDAAAQMEAARSGFEALLGRHLLAFADHGAEFYAGSGNDCHRALHLARINVANRPTRRALEQAYDIASSAGNAAVASELLSTIRKGVGHAVNETSVNDYEGAAV
jgi:tetratricopeptide (TPR) repeat protein